MTSKKERAKKQADLYRIFLQRQRKTNKLFHLGRTTNSSKRQNVKPVVQAQSD